VELPPTEEIRFSFPLSAPEQSLYQENRELARRTS